MAARFLHILGKLEKNRTTLITAPLLIFIFAFIRILADKLLLSEPNGIDLGTVAEWAYLIGLYFTIFLACVFVISFTSRYSIKKIGNAFLLVFPVIVLSPVIDHFITGRIAPYDYTCLTDLSTPGIIVFSIILSCFSGSYVYARCKLQRRLFQAAVSMTSVFVAIMLVTIPLPSLIINYFFDQTLVHPYSLSLYLTLYYFGLSTLFLASTVAISNKELLINFVRNLRLARTIHFIFMVSIGLIVAGNLRFPLINESGVLCVEDYINDLAYIFTCWLGAVLGWQITVMVNDIYDMDIDKISGKERPLITGLLTKEQYTRIVILITIFGIGMSTLLGSIPFFLLMACGFLAWVYSAPPLRLRDRTFSSIIIGLGSCLVYLIGYTASNYTNLQNIFPNDLVFLFTISPTPIFTHDAVLTALIILSALSISPILTDLKDYQGDKEAGVKTIYTLFGLEKGKKMATILIPILVLLPLLLFHNILDIVVFVSLSIVGTILFYVKSDATPVFICYFAVLVYIILRLFDHIPLI